MLSFNFSVQYSNIRSAVCISCVCMSNRTCLFQDEDEWPRLQRAEGGAATASVSTHREDDVELTASTQDSDSSAGELSGELIFVACLLSVLLYVEVVALICFSVGGCWKYEAATHRGGWLGRKITTYVMSWSDWSFV